MRLRPHLQSTRYALAALAVGVTLSGGAMAKPVPAADQLDRMEQLPERLRGVDVAEQLGESVARGVRFRDETGREVSLGDLLDGTRPVILTFNYSSCPMLCSLELNGLVAAMKQIEWTAGQEFRIVTVVLDPNESPAGASAFRDRYVKQYGRDPGAEGWRFVSGSEDSIRAVAASVGFAYGFNEARKEWVHPAAIVLLAPDGKVARYLYGIEYHPKTLRLSLAEVGEGKVGSSIDQLVLYCFHYDADEGRYAPVAMNIMRVSSGLGATLLGGVLASFWLTESRRRHRPEPSSGDGTDGSSPS